MTVFSETSEEAAISRMPTASLPFSANRHVARCRIRADVSSSSNLISDIIRSHLAQYR